MDNQLDWLVDEVKRKGENMPKTITFCNTIKDIASVAFETWKLCIHPSWLN